MMAIKESIVVPGGAKRLNGETKNVKGGFDTTIPNTKLSATFIPSTVGTGQVSIRFRTRTLQQWATLTITGLAIFYQNKFPLPPRARAAAIGLLFPGAGYIACANILGAFAFVLTQALLALSLVAWFGAGGLLFPILVWSLAVVGAYFTAGESIFEYSAVVALVAMASLVIYFTRKDSKERAAGSLKREERNRFLPTAVAELETTAVLPPPDSDRELPLKELRDLQYAIDQSLLAINDWSGFTVIDQFQTAAIRYQLYEMMYLFGTYQGTYVPNFHGYLNKGFRNLIEKSLTKQVMNFWKWESLWGKFTTDYDPVVRDNIMVTGFLTQGIMLYTANTGDMRYTKPNCLKFHITNSVVYEHDIHSMSAALVAQWNSNPYCLFPCEPNWIYTPCNLIGMGGQVLYDRVFGSNHAEEIRPVFEKSLMVDFTATTGSILPIRSAITGFTIPGLEGSLIDLANGLICCGYLDQTAKQMWAIFKKECIQYDKSTEKLNLVGLSGADMVDTGNYTVSDMATYPYIGYVAAEHGDEKIRVAALNMLDEKAGIETTSTGAVKMKSGSFFVGVSRIRASIARYRDWTRVITEGPSKITLAGPILADVPYPGVLVAKARSHTSEDLDLVLYPSASPGPFTLGIERLKAGRTYRYGDEQVVADSEGRVRINVSISGRTEVKLTPA